MQTFLPYPSFIESAKVLDNRRLNKQITEVMQIARALNDSSYGWQNHPAVNMWRGYNAELLLYGVTCYQEWQCRYKEGKRGGKLKHKSGIQICAMLEQHNIICAPPWRGNEQFHSSHRAALLAKDYEWYGQFGWDEEPRIDYIWPANADEGNIELVPFVTT